MAHGLRYYISLHITSSHCMADFPTILVPRLYRAFHSRLPLSLRVPTVLSYCSTGISTCCPSATALDNNYIERIQRYISLSRRNSMFFGSHEGASRAAILYSIAISCRLNGINLFEYICDVIEKTAEWQPNTPLEKYRDLLPDRWKKQ